jgi:riboflavin synthase
VFTGIIEALGEVISLRKEGSNLRITLRTPFASELKEGQSVAHNGVCLTVEKIEASKKTYTITAVKETLAKTNFRKIKAGDKINLERSLKVGDRLDGHFVQGHVDTTAKVKSIKKEKGSWLFSFEVKSQKQAVSEAELSKVKSLILEKGSICVN